MPTEYVCPGCGASVLVPNVAAAQIARDEQLGCNNVEQHDDNTALVMWPDDE